MGLYTDIARSTCTINHEEIMVSSMTSLPGETPKGSYRRVRCCAEIPNNEPRTRAGQMMLAFAGIAGLCVFAKPLTPNNSAYLDSRWKEYCAASGEAYGADITRAVQTSILTFQDQVSSRLQMRQQWIRKLLEKPTCDSMI
ncbi:hypothetical protein WA026_019323 [Henosepilachna vigintioctopunctata]|uniref:Uncharacterized protein n=1 Tax=Henosepilachna vigintioctopunctata TaxID=420089 RepID=A0AAW1UAM1_9CUCU